MTLKNIALATLLASFSIVYCDINSESRIAELKELQFKKQLELSNLGEMIAKRDEFLRSFRSDLIPIFDSVREKKLAKLEKINGRPLSMTETDKVGKDLQSSLDIFWDEFEKISEEHARKILIRELYDQEDRNDPASFQSMKFIIMRAAFEFNLLWKLVDKYATLVQELLVIETTLKNAHI